MKSKEKIIEYMRFKRALSHPSYMDKNDEAAINSWGDGECKYIWRSILGVTDDLRFGTRDCPFCIYHSCKCSTCSYAENHGKCSDFYSDWNRYVSPPIKNILGRIIYKFQQDLQQMAYLIDSECMRRWK